MNPDSRRSRKYLREFNFKSLFIEELGWDHYDKELEIFADSKTFTLSAIAEKRGMAAFLCPCPRNGRIPDYAARRKIEKQTAESVHEHIIIYTDHEETMQIWQWVKREPGKPAACREHTYHKSQTGDSLLQKLQNIAFSLEDEETLTLPHVTGRMRKAFDVERVTKRFYDRFKKEHDSFFSFIMGIPDDDLHRWYASVMLNRLMFIYFVQKKGFLDSDSDYLRNKLMQSKQQGKDLFYKDVLCPLFFEGFAKKAKDRSEKINRLLGEVPYLNGGLFLKHQIEELHGRDIQITDKAFEKLFDFFDQYQWHLDERPLRKDNEINPDVLGYIFEKYINQKQMGAYYTKEDITEYISKNTVIPYLFDAAKKKCKIAFEGVDFVGAGLKPAPTVWQLLQTDPDRYIYDAVKKGVELELPEEIAVGIKDVSKRTEWNKPAASEYALPTEIWREVVARRQRYEEVKSRMLNGDIRSINDLITYNLDIRQFAQDVIWNSEGPELLRAFYHAIEDVTVLDPTCGSGAFLFAALNILEPLYEACLDRMQVFVDELERSEIKHRKDKYGDFKEILKRVGEHPNLKYFIFKSIIVNNLYGVDIMEEAIEICKLRLFLKLVAQIDSIEHIEPLPDIDFNIRAGNTLVGFATYDEVKKAVTGRDQMAMQFDDTMQRIEEQAEDVDRLFQLFHKQQTELGGEVAPEDKQALKDKLKVLEDELNQYLAGEYGIDPNKKTAYEKWLKSHHPFHWFIEFYGILKKGGFDVIIGNPPYVEYSKIKNEYTIKNYGTESCGNIYAFTIERSLKIASTKAFSGLIVPLSLMSTERMSELQSLLLNENRILWISAYDVYPCKLFEGAKQRLSILLTSAKVSEKLLWTSRYNRWKPEEREYLFPLLFFWNSSLEKNISVIPKFGNKISNVILKKVSKYKPASFIRSNEHVSFYVHRIPYNYVKAFDFIPYFYNEKDGVKKSEDYKPYHLLDPKQAIVMLAVLNSNLFFWMWYTLFEGYHCGRHEIYSFPIGLDKMSSDKKSSLIELAEKLMKDINRNKNRKKCWYKKTGKVVYDEFYPRLSKPIIDEIDRVLAKHYGFTDEELDFIINYDIKYRLGIDS
ncbi:MAG TPA: SAM-dependent methyltransferase [Nitrospirae bacterium]|nr:Eco57I restriction-modification methylase [bacterium BMS3Abin06]HDH11439.1 SAM-dependent methyltransferase [Nitrospirota bacterium]HDZ01407.1 SAM-dependent methyltransferase [Nitrospirota bacterium]